MTIDAAYLTDVGAVLYPGGVVTTRALVNVPSWRKALFHWMANTDAGKAWARAQLEAHERRKHDRPASVARFLKVPSPKVHVEIPEAAE